MRICVTNDDGVSANGILALARCLRDHGHDVVIVAPDRDRSGSGTGLGRIEGGDALRIRRIDDHDGIAVYAMDAPPAMCVLAALAGVAGPRPDAVVSGINHGPNLGYAVLHSGTVGAALTARLQGVPGIALSVGEPATGAHGAPVGEDSPVWRHAGLLATRFIDCPEVWGSDWVPNINVPSTWDGEGKLVCARLARLGAIELSAGEGDSVVVKLHTSADLDPVRGGSDQWPTDMAMNALGHPTLTPLAGLGTAPTESAAVERLATSVQPF